MVYEDNETYLNTQGLVKKIGKLLDFNKNELRYLLDLSKELKDAKYAGREEKKLIGKNFFYQLLISLPLSSLKLPTNINIKSINQPIPNIPPVKSHKIPVPTFPA